MLAVLFLSISAARGAVSISGLFASNLNVANGSLNVASGSMVMLLVDVAGDGFIGLPFGASGALPPSTDPGLTSDHAGLATGAYFGGDLILHRRSVVNGVVPISLSNLDITGLESKRFALAWFDGQNFAFAPTNAAKGTRYGIISGSDWILPSINSGSYNFSSTDAGGSNSYYQLNTSSFPSAAFAFISTTANNLPAASFTVVPEPSSALIASATSLLIFRRRRKQALTVIE